MDVIEGEEMKQIMIDGQLFYVPSGEVLSRVLQDNVNYKMPCAGQGRCGKCKVYAKGQLSQPDSVELSLLTEAELKEGVRLACRTRVYGDAVVSLERQGQSRILLGDEVLKGKKRLFKTLGVAVDIGTTTIAAQIFDENGLIAQAGCDNPQAAFGADVISRIERSLAGDARHLAVAVRRGINHLLTCLCDKVNYAPEQIDTIVITGNTAMMYLLTERDPKSLSCAPFLADWLAGEWLKADTLELLCGQADVWLPPCISAFVGADIVTALLEADILKEKNKRVLVDIGTNGEIALWNEEKLLCCATAAGPVFEGAGISNGMQAGEGAISSVKYCEADDSFQVEVIGDCAPVGICGSGVIDAVSCLLKSGLLDETGFLEEETALIGGVSMTQEDIRKVQLAKSAICAGIESLLNRNDLCMEDLDEFLIAGGFGAFLNLESAKFIGLLPKKEPKVTNVCGNAALKGAAKALWNEECEEEARSIAAIAVPLNLAEDPFFSERYMEGMFFDT